MILQYKLLLKAMSINYKSINGLAKKLKINWRTARQIHICINKMRENDKRQKLW
jgi:hypothetical protein